jgi:signal transduction histidine kinase
MSMRGDEHQDGALEESVGTDFSLSLPTSLATAAHELKSPLVLMRQLSLLLQQSEQKLSETQRETLLQQITLTSERALRLTSDLTKAARLDSALFELEPINPVTLCNEIVHELTPLFAAHGRELAVQSRKHPLLLVANRDLLRRILTNFSDNALYYSDPGSAVELQIKALKHGKVIRLGVRDFGPALSSDMWRTLRKKLESQAPQSIHARPHASGLGLYIASQFADAMHGTIGIIRHRDGATFYVDMEASRQLSLL